MRPSNPWDYPQGWRQSTYEANLYKGQCTLVAGAPRSG